MTLFGHSHNPKSTKIQPSTWNSSRPGEHAFTKTTPRTEAQHSHCTKCRFRNAPTINGIALDVHIVWWVIFIVIAALVDTLIRVAVVVVIIVIVTNKGWNDEVQRTIYVFGINWSNIWFVCIGNDVRVSTMIVAFDEKNGVESDARELLYAWNVRKGDKDQLVASTELAEKATYRSEPVVVVLEWGMACEFKFFVMPH